jgi:hypothetical protein
VIAAFLDARFGATRRSIGANLHGRELNEAAFTIGAEVITEVAYETNLRLTELVETLVERGALTLRDALSAEVVGRLIGDGARGINQARPPVPNHLFPQHYREMTEAILFGCAAKTRLG